jgi:hypothetical protein
VLAATFDPQLESFFLGAALICYVFAAIGGVLGFKRPMLSVAFIAAGLALWHFPQLWNQIEGAY